MWIRNILITKTKFHNYRLYRSKVDILHLLFSQTTHQGKASKLFLHKRHNNEKSIPHSPICTYIKSIPFSFHGHIEFTYF